LYSYTRPVRVLHDSYKSALALHILFYFLRSLYIYSSPYLTRDTHYRLIKYITFGVLLCVTHSDHLAVLILSVVVEKLLWPQNRVLFVVFGLDRLYPCIYRHLLAKWPYPFSCGQLYQVRALAYFTQSGASIRCSEKINTTYSLWKASKQPPLLYRKTSHCLHPNLDKWLVLPLL
jgi:hypothetical protein